VPVAWAAIAFVALLGPRGPGPGTAARADEPADFFAAIGLAPPPATDLWGSLSGGGPAAATRIGEPTLLLPPAPLLEDRPPPGLSSLPGMTIDPGRWKFQQEMGGELFKRKTKVELPDPRSLATPYLARDWKAQEKLQIPVPVPLPTAEQLFVYGQLDGSGDTLNNQQTALYGKTGVGVKWSLLAGTELQVRYATLFSYADELSVGWLQGRAQPAVEVVARVPLIGPFEVEYTGSARPAVSRTYTDQFQQELRFAYPMRGDSEFEFGARYRWEYSQSTTPWVDRAQLFLGLRFRH
jgi:hypothetical protein